MVTLSVAAEERIESLLTKAEAEADVAVRVSRQGEGWSLHFDRVLPEDATVSRAGRPLVIADQEASAALEGVLLDMRVSDEEAGFVLLRREEGQHE